MQLKKPASFLQEIASGNEAEWLETNGLGGYCSSALTGCNTRRYHGLLVAAIKPPAVRMVLLSKLDETLVIDNKRFELGINDYGVTIHPTGNQYLQEFTKDLFPCWTYAVNGIMLRKTIFMVQEENTTVIVYEVLASPLPFDMELLPLIAARSYHSLQRHTTNLFWDVNFEDGIFHNQPWAGAPDIYISIKGSTYRHDPKWFYSFNYAIEKYRGLDYLEDLLNHGIFNVSLKAGDHFAVILSTTDPRGRDGLELQIRETQRKNDLLESPHGDLQSTLMLAADQFIATRNIVTQHGEEQLKTVIAGYHWFTDWSRDTMISLPGLCLHTGRAEDAKKIIKASAESVSMGMLPNRFKDGNDLPEYNNADGTLWYFLAIYQYLRATNDLDFILKQILPVLKDIIDWHYRGTRYNIHVDHDGLLYAGEAGQQLTWMDARVGDWVVTPRMGKPVEIQALWYNVLMIFSELLDLNGQEEDAENMRSQADKTKTSFQQRFWSEINQYLYDNINENNLPDPSLRPNQLFAISLPFQLIGQDKALLVLNHVRDKLYTRVGIRSLSPDDVRYTPVYGGDQLKRDSAYHQGTVWPWLIGSYIDAIMKCRGNPGRAEAYKVLQDFSFHLNEACIGSVSEIMNGGGDHHPRGCIAQAWSVAELLRVIGEYELTNDQRFNTE